MINHVNLFRIFYALIIFTSIPYGVYVLGMLIVHGYAPDFTFFYEYKHLAGVLSLFIGVHFTFEYFNRKKL